MPENPPKYLTDMARNMESLSADIKRMDRKVSSFDSAISSIREDFSPDSIASSVSQAIADRGSNVEYDPNQISSDISSKITSSLEGAISDMISAAASKSFSALGDKISSSLDVSMDSVLDGISLPDLKIPGLKKGGKIKKGGTALVGEEGPEILNLPPAAEVIPLKEETKETLDPGAEPPTVVPNPDALPERVNKDFDPDEDDPRYAPEWLKLTQMEEQEFQSRMFYGEKREDLISEIGKRPIGEESDWQRRRMESLRQEEMMDSLSEEKIKTEEKESEPVTKEGTVDSLLTPDTTGTGSPEAEESMEKKTVESGNLLSNESIPTESVEYEQQASGGVESAQPESLGEPVVKQQTESLNENPVVPVEPIGLSPAPEQPKIETPAPEQQQTQTTQQASSMEQGQSIGGSQDSQGGGMTSGTGKSGEASSGQQASQAPTSSDNSELLSVMKQILNVLSGPIKVQGMSPIRPNSKFS